MGENSKIEWTDHTFNPWVGCTKVSPACDFCYAEGWAKRTGNAALWTGERRRTTASNWKQPLKWDIAARLANQRARVFCASLADVFDNQVPDIWRSDLFALIEDTPNLDWLLLTKRPQNIDKMIWPKWDAGLPKNIWLGTTVENQEEADRRIPHLLSAPARVHFLSCEPLLGPIDLTSMAIGSWYLNALTGLRSDGEMRRKINWVIAGGESGSKARPIHPDWPRSLAAQCAAAGVPFFFKQWGEWREPKDGEDYDTSKGRNGKPPAFIISKDGTVHCFQHLGDDNRPVVIRVGKKRAGRLLDGLEHNGTPAMERL